MLVVWFLLEIGVQWCVVAFGFQRLRSVAVEIDGCRDRQLLRSVAVEIGVWVSVFGIWVSVFGV